MKVLGVDTGGTFTDFVLWSQQGIRVHKVLSTPDAPEKAILQGVKELALSSEEFLMIHGSTVATNAALERKGVKTVYVANKGLKDVLTLGRQNREHLYQLNPKPKAPPVPSELCLEVPCRVNASGQEVEALNDDAIEALLKQIDAIKPQAVAINLLFSYLDDSHEKRLAKAMPEGLFVSFSSQVLPEYKEYERGIATWLNAYVGPLVSGYLQRLQAGVGENSVSVMQSSGETIAATQAGQHAVRMLLSGPAGGLIGAKKMGDLCGVDKLLTFDMGGTSTDVALIDGEVRLTSHGEIVGYPVAVPMVDMHTIGAGGGSIAYVDDGGMLQVGPESAGASPGPACYGKGGESVTVTDANLLLGRLQARAFLGGNMSLDQAASRKAMDKLAGDLGVTAEEAAQGVVTLANQHMVNALRVISVQRGIDPAEFTLMCFGGAGGLHVCELAEALGMGKAMVPVHGGVLSAYGMINAQQGRQLSHTLTQPLDEVGETYIAQAMNELSLSGKSELQQEGVSVDDMESVASVDLRYQGQSYTLNVPWQSKQQASEAFHALHEQRFGYRMQEPLELVNVRVALKAKAKPVSMPKLPSAAGDAVSEDIFVVGEQAPVKRFDRDDLMAGQVIEGPALITELVSTTYIKSGWSALVEQHGILQLTRK